jgi:Carbohydrate binding module (family 6)
LSDGVDIETTTDAGGGFDVGHVQVGEWMKYTINVTAQGTYVIQQRVASLTGGTFHFEVDGTTVGGEMTLPNTGGWQNFMTVSSSSFSLTAGQHVVRLVMDSAVNAGQDIGNFNWFKFTAAPTEAAFSGTPAAVPGTIQAENFDTGGAGLAYNIVGNTNNGGTYRPTETVGIVNSLDTSGDQAIGYLRPTDWLKYTVKVATTKKYTLTIRVASASSGGTFHVEFNGVNVTGAITLLGTGGWNTWHTITVSNVSLTAGTQIMRVVMDTAAVAGQDIGNINYFKLA